MLGSTDELGGGERGRIESTAVERLKRDEKVRIVDQDKLKGEMGNAKNEGKPEKRRKGHRQNRETGKV